MCPLASLAFVFLIVLGAVGAVLLDRGAGRDRTGAVLVGHTAAKVFGLYRGFVDTSRY